MGYPAGYPRLKYEFSKWTEEHAINVALKAVSYAKDKGAKTIGLTGFEGGRLAQIVDIPLVAAINDMQKVEDVHMIVVHMLMQYLCKRLQTT